MTLPGRLLHESDTSGRVNPVYEALVCGNCPARKSELCGELKDPELRDLAAASLRQSFAQGDTLIWDGDAATHAYVVTRGALRASKVGADGRRQILSFLFMGDVLTLPPAGAFSITVEALAAGEVCRFERKRFEAVMAKYPGLEQSYRKSAARSLEEAYEHAFTLGRRTAIERVAEFLVEMRVSACPKTPNGAMHLPMTRGDIADFLGLTIETVSRCFSRLKVLKVIALPSAQEVLVEDAERLRALASGEGGMGA